MTSTTFCQRLASIVGSKNIITNQQKNDFYRTGFRSGKGSALAVVFPLTLIQLWQVLKECVADNKIIIMQAANTGLTEGSTPSGDDYDREVIIINTTRMTKIVILDHGKQIISFPGATLHELEKRLKPLSRAPHSVIGSSCIGASIVGGVANNSGGALVKRGPAYTELALYAQLNKQGELELVNHLGIKGLGDTPEEVFKNLEDESFSPSDIQHSQGVASDQNYTQRIRDVNADSPSRYNADKDRLYETSGCAGKLAIFAVRLDTFPIPKQEKVFYIGTNDPQKLTVLRRDMLERFTHLPEKAEYMHRDCFNIAEKYGKDTFLLINYFGTDVMPKLFSVKGAIDATFNKFKWLPSYLIDRLLQTLSKFWPQHLPKRLLDFRDRYEHHLILAASDAGIAETDEYLNKVFCSAENNQSNGFFVCTEVEAKKSFLHRFAAAGAAIRYQVIHDKTVGEVLALDVALKRSELQWLESLPASIAEKIDQSLYYGHFLCHVFHQDYILRKGVDSKALKESMLKILDEREIKYPAEHNVGHLYEAEEGLANFYRELDPTNTFNPGIGKSSKDRVIFTSDI